MIMNAMKFTLLNKTTNSRCTLGVTSRWRIDMDTPWIQRHIAGCARCQERFARLGRVQLALDLLKSQPHGPDLLQRANTATIRVLGKTTRSDPQSRRLRSVTPESKFVERVSGIRGSLTQMAACIALMFLSRMGLFSATQNSQVCGKQALKYFYQKSLGENMADELFPPDSV